MTDDSYSVSRVIAAIEKEGASWQAGPTNLTAMTEEERQRYLGFAPPPGEPSLADREAAATAALAAPQAPRAVGFPASVDLTTYCSPVRDQGPCGSCVAFGSIGAVEGTYRFAARNTNLAIDLSEAHLFFCHARSQGRMCGGANGGWWVPPALDAIRDHGVVDDPCYPYVGQDQNCTGLCGDAGNRVVRIGGWQRLTSTSAMKDWLAANGPLVACFTVYTDFFSYKSGVYKKVSGKVEGGHCIVVVGYDEAQGCWICKNSWGANWGASGYFRIAYGQVGIDAEMWGVSGVEAEWLYNRRILGVWTIDQDRNAWAYIEGTGWKRISADNDNILFDMLAQIIAAKAGNRPCSIRQQGGYIREIYVF